MATCSEITDEETSKLVTETQSSLDIATKNEDCVEQVCANCEKKSSSLKACTRCKSVKYCDKTCQAHHWEEHKSQCRDDKTTVSTSSATTTQTTTTKSTTESKELLKDIICMQCEKMSPDLKSCTRCWNVRYCDRDCQKKHWKQHKLECVQNQRPVVPKDTLDLSRIQSIVAWSEQARLLQGEREMEILPDCDTDEIQESCLKLNERCMKNPGHKGFIAVSQLNLNHLPSELRQPYWLKLIKNQCDRAVKLIVRYTSLNRHDSPFWSGNLRGSRIGSGGLAEKNFKEQPCPIKNCTVSNVPHTVFSINIRTAAHVVYDDSEAAKTTVEFFYNTETDKSSILKLQGVKTIFVDVDGDLCYLTCITHDSDEKNRITKTLLTNTTSKDRITRLLTTPLCYLISHPHGCAKQISFGKIKDTRQDTRYDPDDVKMNINKNTTKHCKKASCAKYQHTCASCPGSSGGMLCVYDRNDGKYTLTKAPHSRHIKTLNVNESSTGFSLSI